MPRMRKPAVQNAMSLFQKVKQSLRSDGLLSIHVGSCYDKPTLELFMEIMKDLELSIETKKVFIPSFCEERIFANGRL